MNIEQVQQLLYARFRTRRSGPKSESICLNYEDFGGRTCTEMHYRGESACRNCHLLQILTEESTVDQSIPRIGKQNRFSLNIEDEQSTD